MTPPKVFLSHASEDKSRFVERFATLLRQNGVDAWLDKWEMLPGDSLVDKIYEEGLKNATAVLIVVSKNSIEKAWVKEELNASIVARIQRGTKVIPVVIDRCDVPEALQSTIWERIDDLDDYTKSFERILASIFGTDMRPRIGEPPKYASAVLTNIQGLSTLDNLVLKSLCEHLMGHPDDIMDPESHFGPDKQHSPPKDEVLESIEILEDAGYLYVSRYFGGGPDGWGCHLRVTLYGFEKYACAYIEAYGQIIDRSAGLIANEEIRTNFDLRDSGKIPLMLANHLIRMFEREGFIKVSEEIGERISIYEVTAKLRRALQ